MLRGCFRIFLYNNQVRVKKKKGRSGLLWFMVLARQTLERIFG